jgi:hypothetical protein
LKRSARLMIGPLSNLTLARFACGLLAALMPLFLLDLSSPLAGGEERQVETAAPPGALTAIRQAEQDDYQAASVLEAVSIAILFAACLAGELLERYLFFAACAAPRMPGGLR